MSSRRRRSGIKSLVGSWRGQQVARENLQDRLASLPYEVLETFLREHGYEPANRGHAIILMVRHFQREAEALVARLARSDSSLRERDTVSATVEDTAVDTSEPVVPKGHASGSGEALPHTATRDGDTDVDAGSQSRVDTVVDTAFDAVADTTDDTAGTTVGETVSARERRLQGESVQHLEAGSDAPDGTPNDTVSDTVKTTAYDTSLDTDGTTALTAAGDRASTTATNSAENTVDNTVAPTVEQTDADPVLDESSDTPMDTPHDGHTGSRTTVSETPSDTVSDAAARSPTGVRVGRPGVSHGDGDERAGKRASSPPQEADGRIRIAFPGRAMALEIPDPGAVVWVPHREWTGPSRRAGEFLRERARWWMERRSATDAGATQFVGVYLLPEYRSTIEQLRSETRMEAYKLLGMALELLLHEAASTASLPELPPRDDRASRVLYLFGVQARPRLDQEGTRLFIRIYPGLWEAVDRISKASRRSPSESCNIAVHVLSATLKQLASSPAPPR